MTTIEGIDNSHEVVAAITGSDLEDAEPGQSGMSNLAGFLIAMGAIGLAVLALPAVLGMGRRRRSFGALPGELGRRGLRGCRYR